MSSPASNTKATQWPVVQRFRNGIPGPFLAKLSPLWKIYHVLRGSYRKKVRKLHDRYGPLVQVGPNEFSLGDKGLVYIPKLKPSPFAVDSEALQRLENSVRMANVYRNEHLIEKCNHQLLRLLSNAAETGESVQLSPLLARYAYETMLATTTGQFAGFLQIDPDADRIQAQMKDWKFFAVLYGSYLKYHPLIAKILKKCGVRGDSQHELFRGTRSSQETDDNADSMPDSSSGQQKEEQALLPGDAEARIALTLAGADPAVILIRTALSYIYSDTGLLQQLREEMKTADVSETPNFKELIAKRFKMPLLHAVLLECIRLNTPLETGPTYKTREEDVLVGGYPVPKGTTIAIEPTIAHVNPTHFGGDANEFQPTRWLDFEVGSAARRHLLAFNLAYSATNLEEFQILLTCKLLTQLLPQVTMSVPHHETFNLPGPIEYDFKVTRMTDVLLHMKPAALYGAHSCAGGDWVNKKTLDSLNIVEVIHNHLTPEVARAICKGGRFDPSRESFIGQPALFTNPIANPMIRAKVRDVFEKLFGDRLQVQRHYTTNRYILFPPTPYNINKYARKTSRNTTYTPSPRNNFQPISSGAAVTKASNSQTAVASQPACTRDASDTAVVKASNPECKTDASTAVASQPASTALVKASAPYCKTESASSKSKKSTNNDEPWVPREERKVVIPKGFTFTDEGLKSTMNWGGWCLGSQIHEGTFVKHNTYEESKKLLAEQAQALEKVNSEREYGPQVFKPTRIEPKKTTESTVETNKPTGFIPPHLRNKPAAAATEVPAAEAEPKQD
ncbi:hypothetical protein M409DRAFT_49590 [Zasmidium cellare ATCC 36951]|uniref:Uncharacterized protein n=1 Tax=Zasmidium cellare ATCC 36951 TaxID=1080233 RepID=A0A6A6D207_ZASCE|nr:uncharacterized protein M409DRAFT_49590 [Zasmidium cellare ATCC 36951]KAF2173103.1 hypothetical protein M409DRAFT_49590 [Zasmidium cellare ATCC 36951]